MVQEYRVKKRVTSITRLQKRYHTGTEHLIPSKLKAPAGKRAFSMPPPDDIDPVAKPKQRHPAQYSNRNHIEEALAKAV